MLKVLACNYLILERKERRRELHTIVLHTKSPRPAHCHQSTSRPGLSSCATPPRAEQSNTARVANIHDHCHQNPSHEFPCRMRSRPPTALLSTSLRSASASDPTCTALRPRPPMNLVVLLQQRPTNSHAGHRIQQPPACLPDFLPDSREMPCHYARPQLYSPPLTPEATDTTPVLGFYQQKQHLLRPPVDFTCSGGLAGQ